MLNKIKPLFWIFPCLFMIELIFGFSGTMLMIGGVAIRHILFILSFVSLYGYLLLYLIENKIKLIAIKGESFIGDFSVIDWLAVVFEISMLLSMTVIPYFMGTSLKYAYSEVFDSAAIFSLYFPLSYLIRKKEIKMQWLYSLLKYAIALFAVMHIVFYFGQEANPTFIQDIFDGIKALFHGNSIAPTVVLGHGGYTRVMFTTSIYLIVGIYLYLRNLQQNKWYDYVIFVLEILAIITTVTKSIWFGIGIAFVIFIVMTVFYNWKNNRKRAVCAIGSAVGAMVIILLSNTLLFHDLVSIRMSNAFRLEAESESEVIEESELSDTEENEIEKLDKEGAAVSNQIKIEQMYRLLDKWKESPLFGHGYGSYVEGYLRSEEAPFSYEMQLFALLMKIGVVGLGIWLVFFIVQMIGMFKNKAKSINNIFSWMFLLMAIVICVQTNPLLISFIGMSVVLLMCLITQDELWVQNR